MDRPPAGGHRPADRQLQAGARSAARRRGAALTPAHEIDLRAEDDALIAAELEAEEAARAEEEAARAAEEAARAEEEAARAPRTARPTRTRTERPGAAAGAAEAAGAAAAAGRRELEGTFDHGEEGYGLWLDPAVADSAVYAEHWAGHRSVAVIVEEDQIVIRRAGDDAEADED